MEHLEHLDEDYVERVAPRRAAEQLCAESEALLFDLKKKRAATAALSLERLKRREVVLRLRASLARLCGGDSADKALQVPSLSLFRASDDSSGWEISGGF